MKMTNRIIGLCMLLVVCSSIAQALIIQGIESDKDSYANGDLVELTVYANEKNLEVTADFSKVDSGYNQGSIISEEIQDFVYRIWYPITFGNNKGSGLRNVVISAYSRTTDTSAIASYGIDIDNAIAINQTKDSDLVRLKVRTIIDYRPPPQYPGDNSQISVRDGMILICDSDGCSTLTEEDYEKGRRVIINSGQVELAELTYNQLKSQITTDVTKEVRTEVQQYITQIIGINKKLDDALFDMKETISNAEKQFVNQTARTEKVQKQAFWFNIITIIIVAVLIVGSGYLIYLKTQSTWLE